jgi:hypothetical protein
MKSAIPSDLLKLKKRFELGGKLAPSALLPSGSRNILLSLVNHLPPVTLKFFGDSKGLPVVVHIPGLF